MSRCLLPCLALIAVMLLVSVPAGRAQTATPTPSRTPTPTRTPKPTLASVRNPCARPPLMDGIVLPQEYGGSPLIAAMDATSAAFIVPQLPEPIIPDASYDVYMTWSPTDLYFAVVVHDDRGDDGGLLNESTTNLKENDTAMVFFDPNRSRNARPQFDDFAVQFCGGGSVSESLLSFGDGLWLDLGNAGPAGEVKGLGKTGETSYAFEARFSLNEMGLVGADDFNDMDYTNNPAWRVDSTNIAGGNPNDPNDASPLVLAPEGNGVLQVWDASETHTVMHTTDLRAPLSQDGRARLFLPKHDAWRGLGLTALDAGGIVPDFQSWKMAPAYWLILSSTDRPGGIVAGLNLTRPNPFAFVFTTYPNQPDSPIRIDPQYSVLLGTAGFAPDPEVGHWYEVRWQKSGATVRAKAWREDENEPAGWQIDVSDPPTTAGREDGLREGWWLVGDETLETWSQLALAGARGSVGAIDAYLALADEIQALGAFAPTDGRVWGMDVVLIDNLGEMQWNSPGPGPVQQQSPSLWTSVVFREAQDFDCDGIADEIESGSTTVPPGMTNRYLRDSDGDGIPDGAEDWNRNGVLDPGELNPRSLDTDGDRIADMLEADKSKMQRFLPSWNRTDELDPLWPKDDPNDPYLGNVHIDTDNDNLQDYLDWRILDPDSDDDRFTDGYEYMHGGLFDHRNASVVPSLGDVNRDGYASNLDALIIQTFFLRLIGPESMGNGWDYSDVNRDGQISNLDGLILQTWFLDLFPWLPSN